MDKLQGESVEMIPDICSCGKGRLKKGTTDFTAKVEEEINNQDDFGRTKIQDKKK
jgi:hypothetical protein